MLDHSTDPQTAADDIARQLNEDNTAVVAQIERVIERLGVAAAYAVLEETQRIEAEGGLLTENRERRRTPGGLFFYLVRGRITPDDYLFIWPQSPMPYFLARQTKQPLRSRPRTRRLPLAWQEYLKALPQLLTQQGTVMSAKLTLVGRPGKIIDKGDLILTTLTSRKAPTLSKGLPPPPDEPTVYLVFITRGASHGRYPEITEEMISTARLDVILLASEPFPFGDKYRTALAAQIPKIAVFLVDGKMFSWYGSRLLLSADYLRLFPQPYLKSWVI